MRRINTDLRFSFRQWQSLGRNGHWDAAILMAVMHSQLP